MKGKELKKGREKHMESKKTYMIGKVLMVVLGLTALVLCFGMTAMAREKKLAREERQNFYLEQKKEVIREVGEFLAEQGYPQSGITLTKREFGEDEEEYRLTVHHGRMDRLSQEERDRLTEELAGFAIGFDRDAVMHVTIQ